MSPQFRAAALIVLFAAVVSATTARTKSQRMIEPPKDLPRAQTGDTNVNLDRLFEALKIAPDADSAKYIEGRIWALWFASGSDTANLLMSRVKTATDAKDVDLALKLLNSVIDIKPDFLEAWNRRATLHFMKKEYGPRARRPSAGADARAAAFRCALRARHHSAGDSATTSARSKPSAVRSRSILTSSGFPTS